MRKAFGFQATKQFAHHGHSPSKLVTHKRQGVTVTPWNTGGVTLVPTGVIFYPTDMKVRLVKHG